MGAQVIDRRLFLAGASALAATLPTRALAIPPAPPRGTSEQLKVSDARSTEMTVWRPTTPMRGVALFSTGHGSWPARYEALAGLLSTQGFATVAPMHVDSMRYPDRASFTREASFAERIADMRAASAWAATQFPDQPLVAAGHSFGTLTALSLAGGLAYLGDFRDPAVRAVLGFSSPGRIPGLVQPTGYAGVSAPLMLVTGTADIVPGFVTDPADHLFPVETVAGPAFGLVVKGAGHEFVAGDDPAFWTLADPIGAFLAGYTRDEAAARRRLAAYQPADGIRFIARNTA